MEQRVTRIGAAGAKRGNKAIKYEVVGKTRDPAALFTGWCGGGGVDARRRR